MYEYIKGIITKQLANYIVVESNGIGYKLFTPNPYKFKESEVKYMRVEKMNIVSKYCMMTSVDRI